MKIIHCADIHLGSKMDSVLPREKADERRVEVRATFSRMIEYARKNGVRVILLAGDIFDSDRPLKKDKQFFYDAVRANPEIDFLYLRGNHDRGESYTENLPNLKTFSNEWTGYSYGGIVISGLEISAENCVSMYSTLNLNPRNKNIVMLHGQAGDRSQDGCINLLRLADKSIDYLALGHIHSHKSGRLDGRGVYSYSGCLEGRGFDEAGEKGFVLLDVGEGISAEFVPFARRTVFEVAVDVSTTKNAYGCYQMLISTLNFPRDSLLKVALKGEIDYDDYRICKELEEQLSTDYYFVTVRNDTRKRLDLEKLAGEISLRGEFVRQVLASGYPDGRKREIIAAGLKALDGREAEL